jgi:hypothetical protein
LQLIACSFFYDNIIVKSYMSSSRKVERKEEQKEDTAAPTTTRTTTSSLSSSAEDTAATTSATREDTTNQQSAAAAVHRVLDETKDNIRRSTDEARREIPRYTQAVNDYQQHILDASREIADNYIESQKQIINSLQSALVPQIENAYRMFWNNNWVSPRILTEIYARAVNSIADNTIAVTKLANNTIFANMEVFKTSIQHVRDNAKELSRIGVNTAKTFENTAREAAAREGYYKYSHAQGIPA